jgi:hypothetical protein
MARLVEAKISTHVGDPMGTGTVYGLYFNMREVIKLAPALESSDTKELYSNKEELLFNGNVRSEVWIDAEDEERRVPYGALKENSG